MSDPAEIGSASVGERRSIGISEIAPADWNFPNRPVWIAAFRVFDLPAHMVARIKAGFAVTVVLGNVQGIVFFGNPPAIPGVERLRLRTWAGGDPEIEAFVEKPSTDAASDGFWLLLLTPEPDSSMPERDAMDAIDRAVAIVRLFGHRNAAYDEPRLRSRIHKDGASTPSPGILAPNALPDADFAELATSRMSRVAALAGSGNPVSDRLQLALRWAKRGEELEGVDSVIAWWIAIETLAMPDGTNVRPIVEILARRAGLPFSEAVARYQIGRLQGVRSKVVHNGFAGRFGVRLPHYLRAVFLDLVGDSLDENFGEVEALLRTPGFDLDDTLRTR